MSNMSYVFFPYILHSPSIPHFSPPPSSLSQFGKVERAVVACNEQGRSLCEGVVEFERKNSAQQALQRINNGAFLLTPGPRPIIAESLEHRLDAGR